MGTICFKCGTIEAICQKLGFWRCFRNNFPDFVASETPETARLSDRWSKKGRRLAPFLKVMSVADQQL